jgi:hypothetical protein
LLSFFGDFAPGGARLRCAAEMESRRMSWLLFALAASRRFAMRREAQCRTEFARLSNAH